MRPEVGLRRRLHAVGLVAVVDAVQVGLQDLGLGVTVLELHREDRLVELAQDRPVTGKVDVLGQLLGDGAATLGDPALEEVLAGRPQDAEQVDPAVAVEVVVLDRDRSPLHAGRHLRDWNQVAPLAALVDLGQQHPTGPVVDPGRQRQPGAGEIGGGGESGPDVERARQEDQHEPRGQGGQYDPGPAQACPAGGAEAAVARHPGPAGPASCPVSQYNVRL